MSVNAQRSQERFAKRIVEEREDLLMPRTLKLSSPQIKKLSMKRMILDYGRDLQQWSKIWPHNGFKVIRAKSKTAQNTMECLRRFQPIDEDPTTKYTDDSMQFIKA